MDASARSYPVDLHPSTSRISASRRASIGLVDCPPAGPGWLPALALRHQPMIYNIYTL
jgi:hypothetical protein